ncbi:MAG: formylglycine-generating enzyme family protein [Proteobacteria bacterium]|nr:formylglycine-generating enzyme family protein [Pseudomonadota bacterium]
MKCPVCENPAALDLSTCPLCGWRFEGLIGEPDPAFLAENRENLVKAQKAWNEKKLSEIRYSEKTAKPDFEKDAFENSAEYGKRIDAHSPVAIGRARLLKEDYDLASGKFPLEMTELQPWYNERFPAVRSPFIVAVRDQARDLHRSQNDFPIFATFKMSRDGIRAGALELLGNRKVFTVQYEKMPREYTDRWDMKFVLIPAGTFLMGSSALPEEQPSHRVVIDKPFYLGKYPVRQSEYRKVTRKNRSRFGDNPQNPVESVTWDDANRFVKLLNNREGSAVYRLPSEAEWEYAAKAGTSDAFFFGNESADLSNYAWYRKNAKQRTQPVGLLKANPWDLHDMLGNVWEWVADKGKPYGADGDSRNKWSVDKENEYVIRGGSWSNKAEDCRAARRNFSPPGNSSAVIGFRLVRTITD